MYQSFRQTRSPMPPVLGLTLYATRAEAAVAHDNRRTTRLWSVECVLIQYMSLHYSCTVLVVDIENHLVGGGIPKAAR